MHQALDYFVSTECKCLPIIPPESWPSSDGKIIKQTNTLKDKMKTADGRITFGNLKSSATPGICFRLEKAECQNAEYNEAKR